MPKPPAKTVQSANASIVKEWYDRNEILLIDVRETSEYDVEHIPGSLLLPLSSFDPEFFPTLPGKRIVLHCAIGKRSEAAGKMLLNEGHLGAIHMTGGLEAWKAAGFATEVQILPPDTGDIPPKPAFLCPPPGRVLQNEYLKPLKISQTELADRIGIAEETISALISGSVVVDVELSLRLARYFSTAADFWVRLQTENDLEQARHKIGDDIKQQIIPRTTAG